MAGVTINSGPVEPEMFLKQVPPTKWEELVRLRRDFMDRELSYDCRCLVRFIKEADKMWQPLGYKSKDDLITRGYDLEPEEIHLAIRWLELNDPEEVIGLEEVKARSARERSMEAAKATTGEVRERADNQHVQIAHAPAGERAEQQGVSLRQQRKLDTLARKNPALLQEVQQGKKSCHRACVEAGIVKVPSVVELFVKLWTRATPHEQEQIRQVVGGKA